MVKPRNGLLYALVLAVTLACLGSAESDAYAAALKSKSAAVTSSVPRPGSRPLSGEPDVGQTNAPKVSPQPGGTNPFDWDLDIYVLKVRGVGSAFKASISRWIRSSY